MGPPRVLLAYGRPLPARLWEALSGPLAGADLTLAPSPETLAAVAGRRFDLVLAGSRLASGGWLAGAGNMGPLAVLGPGRDLAAARAAMLLGAVAYLPEDAPPAVVAASVALALAGGGTVPMALAASLAAAAPAGRDAMGGLPAREAEVLGFLARGMANKEIARQLGLAEATVKLHLKSLSRRLGARNRTDVVLQAQALGLVSPPGAPRAGS